MSRNSNVMSFQEFPDEVNYDSSRNEISPTARERIRNFGRSAIKTYDTVH